jgi:hypothetical protein
LGVRGVLQQDPEMNRRTLAFLALPAVIAAMTVAVPALAGSSSGGGAHKSSAPKAKTSAKCIIALVGKRRVRECLIAGPRGPRGSQGVRGFLGPNGPRGVAGKTGRAGATGATGPAGSAGTPGAPGTARAYALVQPPGALVQNVGFSSVRRSGTGIYCLVASGINPATEAPVASGEAGYSRSGAVPAVPLAVVYAKQPPADCAPGEFEVRTYDLSSGRPVPSEEVAFTIIVP